MKKLKKTNVFGESAGAAHSEKALYINPHTGAQEIVQAMGSHLDEHSRYINEEFDVDHLACLHCSAKLSYHAPTVSSGGSSADGDPGYFFGTHDASCLLFEPSSRTNRPYIDRSKGPRLHINTVEFSPDLNNLSGVYEISTGGKKTLTNDDLRDREPITITKAQDVLDLIENYTRAKRTEKLNDAVFIFQNSLQTWSETFIRAGATARHQDLVRRVVEWNKKDEPPFAIVEVTTTKRHDASYTRKDPNDPLSRRVVPPAPVERIELGTMTDGRKAYVDYLIYIDEQKSDLPRIAMAQARSYFVMGEVRGGHYTETEGNKELGIEPHCVYSLYMKVTDSRQVAWDSTPELQEKLSKPRERKTPINPDPYASWPMDPSPRD